MPNSLSENDWKMLLSRISSDQCTPFLGAGASAELFPAGRKLADMLADDCEYPFNDRHDLARVSQYHAIRNSDMIASKEKVVGLLKAVPSLSLDDPDEPYTVFSSLPLSLFITTNYDNFMSESLSLRGKNPKHEVCRWNKFLKAFADARLKGAYNPTATNPLVYHLHGHVSTLESLVLSEDDYLDFMVSFFENPKLLHSRIQRALAGSSLLFVGYSFSDFNFRVLFRLIAGGLERSLKRLHVAVQLPPEPELGISPDVVQRYLNSYFEEGMNVRVYWGTAREFARDLRERWDGFAHPS